MYYPRRSLILYSLDFVFSAKLGFLIASTLRHEYYSVQVFADTRVLDLIPSEEIRKTVNFRIERHVNEYLRDPTGLQTLTSSYQSSPTQVIEISFRSSSNDSGQIYDIFRHSGRLCHHLSQYFTSYIAATGMRLVGVNSYVLTLTLRLTEQRVYGLNIDFSALLPGGGGGEEEGDVVERLVRDGAIDNKEGLDLGLEQEACSICFEKLLGASDKVATRMSCSHVFHDRCISQWLHRKNSCPLCRRLLYGRQMTNQDNRF